MNNRAGDGRLSGRAVAGALLRPVAAGAALTVAYFLFPLGRAETGTLAWLTVGALVLIAVIGWEIHRFRHSNHPVATAAEMLVAMAMFYLIVFSFTYFLMSEYGRNPFNTDLTRLDALYFSLTVFTTTGFGDIAPASQAARAVVAVQMLSTLIVVGLGVRLLRVVVSHRLADRDET